MRLWWIVLVVVVEATAFADPDPALEKRFRDDIAAVSGEAAAAWDAANAARDAHHPSEAADGYRKAIALAPKVDHPHRRLCSMLMLQHQLDEAAAECERAMQLAPASPYDASTYAYVLLRRDQAGDRARAVTLASQAARALPNDPDVVGTQCTALAFENDIDAMRGCVDHLLDIAPNSVVANLHGVQLAMFDHDPTHASIYLERAKTAGLPDAEYRTLRSQVDAMRRPTESLIDSDRAIAIGVPAVLGWFLVLCVLLMVGNALSDATLRRVDGDSVRVSRV